jgi:hypothetical protein
MRKLVLLIAFQDGRQSFEVHEKYIRYVYIEWLTAAECKLQDATLVCIDIENQDTILQIRDQDITSTPQIKLLEGWNWWES